MSNEVSILEESPFDLRISRNTPVTYVFHEMFWKKNFTVYPTLNIRSCPVNLLDKHATNVIKNKHYIDFFHIFGYQFFNGIITFKSASISYHQPKYIVFPWCNLAYNLPPPLGKVIPYFEPPHLSGLLGMFSNPHIFQIPFDR